MTRAEYYAVEEHTLTHVLEQVIFLRENMDILKLVDQKKIKSVDQLLAMGPGPKDLQNSILKMKEFFVL